MANIKAVRSATGRNRAVVEVNPNTGLIRATTNTESASETVNPWDAATDKASAA
jgi:hypothetical protein